MTRHLRLVARRLRPCSALLEPALPLQWLRYAWCAVRWVWLGHDIRSTANYLRDCARDGLHQSLHLDEWHFRLADMREQRAACRAQLRRGLTPWLL